MRAKNTGRGKKKDVKKGTFKHTADHAPQTTAALALIYRELYNARLFSAEEVIDYCEEAPGDLSVMTIAAAQGLPDADWMALRLFDEHPNQIATWARHIHEADPARAEVLLHFWPAEGIPPFGACWTYPYIGPRWDEVESAIIFLEGRGLFAKRDDVDHIARKAWIGMGGSADIESWLDLCEAAEESAAAAG